MPDGELETVPDPDFTIDKLHMRVNVAVTVVFVFIATFMSFPYLNNRLTSQKKRYPN